MTKFARFATVVFALAIASLPAFAQRLEKKASGKGDVNPSAGCVAGGSNNPCVVFSTTSATTATWTNFLFDGSTDGPFDLFMVPTTAPVTFQLTGPNVTYGSFLCGFDSTMTDLLEHFCTNIDDSADPASFLTSNPANADASNKVLFSFNSAAAGLPADWVFYADSGKATIVEGTTGVPEPGTFALLAGGLLGLGAFRRRFALR